MARSSLPDLTTNCTKKVPLGINTALPKYYEISTDSPNYNLTHVFLYFVFVFWIEPKVILSSRVVRTLPGYSIFTCSATGTPPVHIALVRNTTTLRNTTDKYVEHIRLFEEGMYACVASSVYGTDVKEFKVIFIGETFKIYKHSQLLIYAILMVYMYI